MLSLVLAVAVAVAAQTAGGTAPQNPVATPEAATAAPAAASPTPVPVPPGEVLGVVLRPDGKPAAKARVALIPVNPAGRAPVDLLLTTADDLGAFRVDARGLKSFTLMAHLRPFAVTTLPRQQSGRRVSLRLEAGGRINGSVADATTGLPLANTSIEASEWELSPLIEVDPDFGMVRTSSDAKGNFALTGLAPSGRLVARAQKRGYATGTVTSVPGTGLKFRLEPGHNLDGVIADANGRPIAKAVVLLRPTIRVGSGNVTVHSTPEGRFEAVGLRNIAYDVTITAPGFTPFLKDAISADAPSLRVTLERPARVTGRFVDEENKPLQGVARVRSWSGEATPAEVDRFVTAETKSDGTFTLSGLKAGANTIDLRADDFPRVERKIEIARAAEIVALGDVRFERGLTIRGRAAMIDDTPVPGARITASRAVRTGPAPPESFFAQTNQEGQFEFKGLQGEAYQLSITAEGFARQTIKAVPSEENVAVLMRRTIPLSGRLVDAESQPIGQARVGAQKGADSAGSASAQSTADGRFTLDLGEGGQILLSVTADAFTPLTRTLQIESETDLGDVVLSRGLRLKGIVVDGRGTGVAGARVENQTTRQTPVTFVETDDKGRFEISGAIPGRVRLSASHFQYSSGQAFVEVKEGEEPDEARIVLGAGGRVEGVVRQRDGLPVSQAIVQLFPQTFNDPLRPPSGVPAMTLTQPDGSYFFEHVFPGSMNVVLMTGQQGSYTNVDQSAIAVVEGETATANLTLRTTIVRGVLSRKSDSPAGLRVTLRGGNVMMLGGQMRIASLVGDIPWHSAIADADGRFALRVVGPLNGQVAVASVDRPVTLLTKPVQVPDVDEFQLPLDLAGTRVSGRVVDGPDGKGIGEATVLVKSLPADAQRARSWFARSDGAGTFGIELEPGDYQILVTADGFAGSAPAKITVASADLAMGDISLSRGGTISGRATLGGQPLAQARVDAATRAGENTQTRYSGPDGHFTIGGLADDTVRVVVSDDAGHVGMQLVSPGSTEPIEVPLGPAARLNITLIGPKESFPGINVTIPRIDGIPSTGWSRADMNGRATLFALPGETTLRASSEALFGEAVVQTRAGETTEVTIELKPVKGPVARD